MEHFAQLGRLGAETLAPIIVDVSLKATLLLLLAAVTAGLCSRKSASLRHQIWLIAILAVLALPLISLTLPAWRVLPAWSRLPITPPPKLHPAPTGETQITTAAYAPKHFSGAHAPARRTSSGAIVFYATAVWTAGALFRHPFSSERPFAANFNPPFTTRHRPISP